MKRVLLFSDIGGHEYQEYYHVGDEAMWYETLRWYQEYRPDWEVSSLSWFPQDKKHLGTQYPHLHWPPKNKKYFFLLLFRFLVWKIRPHVNVPYEEKLLFERIQKNDILHFCGGGNLSTSFRPWLYYSFFLILAAKILNKKILLTSQTIGPFSLIDSLAAFFFLHLVHALSLRSKKAPQSWILPGHKTWLALDSAYSLSPKKNTRPPIGKTNIKKKAVTIGLSIHAWPKYEHETKKVLIETIRLAAKKYLLTIVFLPHHLDKNNQDSDHTFLLESILQLQKKHHFTVLPYKRNSKNHLTLAQEIKKQTAEVDVLLTTRYHGIIFGLSSNTPTIELHSDEYYREKNQGALSWWYAESYLHFSIGLKSADAQNQLWQKLQNLVHNQRHLKCFLQVKNSQLTNTGPILQKSLPFLLKKILL